jgi:ATP dependent DNA ligase domain
LSADFVSVPKKTPPAFVPPMMAERTKAPFDDADWIFEIKLDGYRAITVFDAAGKPHLWSRNSLPLEAKFPAISKLKLRSTILDGEVVAVDENGIPRFQLLQKFQKQPTAPTLYYVFDILWHDGDDLTRKPLVDRKPVHPVHPLSRGAKAKLLLKLKRTHLTNGMVVSDGTFQRISIKHSGFNPDSEIEASFKVLTAVPEIINKVQLFQDRILTDAAWGRGFRRERSNIM